MKTKKWIGVGTALVLSLLAADVRSMEIGEDFWMSGILRNQSEIRAHSGPDTLMSSRFELTNDFSYQGIPHLTFFLRTRLFYDAVFDIEDDGTGGGGHDLRDPWYTNVDFRGEEIDPIFREAYADVNFGNFFGRLGRQLVSWGRADGVVLLDRVNPTNFRRPLIVEVEDIRIPLWMANLNYTYLPSQSIQVLWIPRYVPLATPGLNDVDEFTLADALDPDMDFHDWTLNVIKFRNIGLTIPPGTAVVNGRPGTNFKNSEAALRLQGVLYDFAYTVNYFYSWTDLPGLFGNFGTDENPMPAFTPEGQAIVVQKPVRFHMFGFSLDRGWSGLPGPLENLVTRLEWAYFIDDLFVQFEGPFAPFVPANTVRKDHTGFLLGLDNFVYNPLLNDYTFVSLQASQDWIIDPIHSDNAYYDLGSTEPFKGFRDQEKTTLTAFFQQGFLTGDTLNFTFLGVYEVEFNDAWIRPELVYDVSTRIQAKLGMNIFFGDENDPLGQFEQNQQVFTEISYSLF